MKFSLFGNLEGESTNAGVEEKQKKFKVFVLIGFVVFFIFIMFYFDKKKPQNEAGDFKLYSENNTIKTRWINQAQGEIEQQKKSVTTLNKRVQEISEENKKLRDELEKQKRSSEPETNSKNDSTDEGLYKNFPKPKNSAMLEKFVPPSIQNLDSLVNQKNKNKPSDEATKNMFDKTPVVERQVYQESLAVEHVQIKNNQDAKKPKSLLDILPTGTIIRATLVNGMDAPTMSQAKDNPLVTHMIVKDLAILPNKFKYDIRECFVLGEGYGDLASERVYIRANNLSCITEDGEHIDYELKGYVAGEDGKIGLRGTVVSKQGAFLARAIVGGFVDGVGKAFSQVGNTVQVTPYGTTTTNTDISSSELAKKGIYSGLSSGASKLADFYLKLADQVFPVIEISAGRDVNIVVSGKRDMTTIEEEDTHKQNTNNNSKDKK